MSNAAYFPVRYSQLDPDAVKSELVKRYKLEEPVSCRVFDYGLNDIYIVKAGNEVYYLRISLSNMHQRCDYEEEVFIISTLCKNGIHAAAPVHCKDGFYVWEINAPEGTRYAVLFTEAKKAPSEDKVKMGYNLGSELAKLHKTADEYDFKVSRAPIDLIQLADKPLHMLQPYLSNRTADYEFLCNAAEALCHKIEETLSCEKPYYGYCHGDIHGGNVFLTVTLLKYSILTAWAMDGVRMISAYLHGMKPLAMKSISNQMNGRLFLTAIIPYAD